jgi:hypothetical protein
MYGIIQSIWSFFQWFMSNIVEVQLVLFKKQWSTYILKCITMCSSVAEIL